MVSILLPFKNAGKWIEETIASVCAQDYGNWELLCIDDHSSDASASIVAAYAKKDSRIKLYQSPKKGIIPALQFALNQSKGAFITRMDADDLMPPGRLKKFIDVLSNSDSKTIVTGKVQYFSGDQVSEGYRSYESWLNERIDKNDHYDHIYRECVVASPNWLARKDDLVKSAIFDQLEYPEDYAMTFLWQENNFQIKGIDAITLYWREHPERTSRNSSVYDQLSFFNLKIGHFIRKIDSAQSIGILGAGRKGKITAEIFTANDVAFNWYDLRYEKFAGSGADIKSYEAITDDLLLISVYPESLADLLNYLEQKQYRIGENAWFL